jgi:DNA replication and repair protein RecF
LHIESIRLSNFRNFASAEVDFTEHRNLIVGTNAQGKTNLLEAIHILCVGRSHRDRKDHNLVKFGEAVFRVEGVFRHAGVRSTVEVGCGEDRGEERKRIRVNGKETRPAAIIGLAPVVISSPDDIDLIKRSPGYRRTFLDMALSQASREYLTTLQQYTRALAHRNVLLKRACEGRPVKGEIEVWDAAICDLGEKIVTTRLAFLADIGPGVEENFSTMSGVATTIDLVYEPRGYRLSGIDRRGAAESPGDGGVPPLSAVSSVREGLRQAMRAARQMELARGFTLFGPHVDDFRFMCDGHDIRLFGSEGEQRTAVLALRCAEVAVMMAKIGYYPIVLLDDVFAELDEARSRALTSLISGFNQIILTSSRAGDLARGEIEEITVADGRVTYGG